MTCPTERVSGPCISLKMGRSHSSRRLAGVRGGVGGGETLRASAEFGRDGQSGLGPGRSNMHLAPMVEAVEGGTRGLFIRYFLKYLGCAGSPDPGS